ncbi:DUF421 domain-containing protein [Paenibacillus methanolicus]|uniref:Uncharacterized membrane protein YcaP (DUF421 family) n=1 Tax=Paenibacillus methanolicus TaxID=582686 RepID=A0A5S5C632_9BACL|nr:DUF421 domain-containing protein [Paenibacillus methanolicus]TYP74891.1 uncharacterized membrane protein YcaP (DUF421 family) [Paenibacillus methanolicus]
MPDWLEAAARTLTAIVILFFLTKMLGKRQVSQLSVFEYMTGITIGSLAAYVSINLSTPWYLGLVSLVVWVSFSYGMEFAQMKSKRVRAFVEGKATVLIQQGRVLEANMREERLTTDELLQELRRSGVFRLADAEFALMETSGEINVMTAGDTRPLTKRDFGMHTGMKHEPIAVLMDGTVMEEQLASIRLNRGWLDHELARRGLAAEDVFLAQLDADGELYIDLYRDTPGAEDSG